MSKRLLRLSIPLLLLAVGATSCVDSDYDLSKDIDATMQLGSNGLQLKLGNTEEILLGNILEENDQVQTDANSLYYIVEKGQSNTRFDIGSFTASFESITLRPEEDILNSGNLSALVGTTLPQGYSFPVVSATATGQFAYDVTDIPTDVKQLTSARPTEGTRVHITLEIEQSNLDVQLSSLQNATLTFPSTLRVSETTVGTVSGHVISYDNLTGLATRRLDLGYATLTGIDFPGETGVVGSSRRLHIGEQIALQGNFGVSAASNISPTQASRANVKLCLTFLAASGRENTISIASATGRFDPDINPDDIQIDIAPSLPNFLQDDSVRIMAGRPTARFDVDMTQVPATLEAAIDVSAVKDEATIAQARMPESGKAEIVSGEQNTLYFYASATEGPYDPEGVVSGAARYQVSSLGTLLERLPDYINVQTNDGRISLKDEDCTVELGRQYNAALNYKIYVPFHFNRGLRIVYRDSINEMNDDLQDYQADSAQVSATIENTIPLDLNLSLTPIDVAGREMPGVHITRAVAAAAAQDGTPTSTDVVLNVKLDNAADLQRLDKLLFRVEAEAEEAEGDLRSDQYLRVKDLRIRLLGPVTANFN